MYYLIIGGLDSLGHWNGLPMVSALVCMVTHWTRPTMGYDIRLSGGHDFTKLLCCIVFQP